MGTNTETTEVQLQIKRIIKELGWTQNKFARILYTEMNEWDDEDEILKFQERVKKELQRTSTKVEKLKKYLEILMQLPETQTIDVVSNRYVPQGAISLSLGRAMADISQEINNQYKKKTI
jgi:hypothetical protein